MSEIASKGFSVTLKDKQNQVSRDKGISFKGFLKGVFSLSPLFVLGYFSRLTQRMDHSLVSRELTTNTLVPTLQQANCSSITDQLNGVVVPAGIGGLRQDVSGYKNLLVNSANHYDPMPNEEPRSTFYDNQADAVDKLNQNRQAYNDNGCDTLDSDNDMVCSHGPLAEQFDSAVTIYRDMSDKQGTDFEIRSRDDILNEQQFNSSLLPNGYVHYVFKNATTQWLYSIDDQGAFYDTNNQKLNLPFFYDSISGFNLVRKSLVPVCDSLDFSNSIHVGASNTTVLSDDSVSQDSSNSNDGSVAGDPSGNSTTPISSDGNATVPIDNGNSTDLTDNGNSTDPINNGNSTTPISSDGNSTVPIDNGNSTDPINNGNSSTPISSDGNSTVPIDNGNSTDLTDNGNSTDPIDNGNSTTPISNDGNSTDPIDNGNSTLPIDDDNKPNDDDVFLNEGAFIAYYVSGSVVSLFGIYALKKWISNKLTDIRGRSVAESSSEDNTV